MKWWDQMPWSSFSECWGLSQLFHSPLSLSSRGFTVPLHFLLWLEGPKLVWAKDVTLLYQRQAQVHLAKSCNLPNSLWTTIDFIYFFLAWTHVGPLQMPILWWHSCVCTCSVTQPWWLFATLWTVTHQAPLSMEFSRQEYWSGLPFPSPVDLPDPGIKLESPAFPNLAGIFFTTTSPGKWSIHMAPSFYSFFF